MAENDLVVANDTLIKLGLEPTRLSDGLMDEVVRVAEKHRERCDTSRIVCSSLWIKPLAAE